jgi:hypothetical protein
MFNVLEEKLNANRLIFRRYRTNPFRINFKVDVEKLVHFTELSSWLGNMDVGAILLVSSNTIPSGHCKANFRLY